MRLLNTHTGNFEEFLDNSSIPRFAILSHTWSPDGEQTYQDVRKMQEGHTQELVKLKISPPTCHSASLPAMQREGPFEPIPNGSVAPASATEVVNGRNDRSLEGTFTLTLAWILLTLMARLVGPSASLADQQHARRARFPHSLPPFPSPRYLEPVSWTQRQDPEGVRSGPSRRLRVHLD